MNKREHIQRPGDALGEDHKISVVPGGGESSGGRSRPEGIRRGTLRQKLGKIGWERRSWVSYYSV